MERVETTNECLPQNCPCAEVCPLKSALERIGGKWKIRIICALAQDGATRYGELKRKIEGITNTMLASSLRDLEKEGLISRVQYSEIPVRVEYSATEACLRLVPILAKLVEWEKEESG